MLTAITEYADGDTNGVKSDGKKMAAREGGRAELLAAREGA